MWFLVQHDFFENKVKCWGMNQTTCFSASTTRVVEHNRKLCVLQETCFNLYLTRFVQLRSEISYEGDLAKKAAA